MRTISVILVFILFFIIGLPFLAAGFIVACFSKRAGAVFAGSVIRFSCRAVLAAAGVKLRVIGSDRVPRERAVLYTFNHRSYFDAVICCATAPSSYTFISMASMKKVPVINLWMVLMRCLFLDRSRLRDGRRVIYEGAELIKEGLSIFIAPEGRINPNSETEPLPFKEGSFMLARISGCPVIPVAISNSRSVFEAQFPFIKSVNVIIEYSYPVYPAQGNRNPGKEIRDKVKSMLVKHNKEI
ncbi:MAG: lysophospholipid acyltransferase family protein [Eubacteriales bacterium]|nr:lysophospholipid acyltransferase family protein [Eubacteriales bacterium]